MTRCTTFFAAALIAAGFSAAHANAQAIPAAKRAGGRLQAGVAYSNANPDVLPGRIGGFTLYGDYYLFPHISVEADVHLLQFFTPHDYAQRSYVGGGRFYYRVNRFEPYAKVMGGVATGVAQTPYADSVAAVGQSFAILEVGGGVDIDLPHRLVLRAVDYDFQQWRSFEPHTLSPSIISFGVAYRIR